MLQTRKQQILLTVFVSALLISGLFATRGVMAASKIETETVRNTFTAMEAVIPEIDEQVTDPEQDGYILEKDDVTIKNTDSFDAEVRAVVIASWQDAEGNLLAVTPVEGTDYQITYGSDWEKRSDGFYYYKSVLGTGESTTSLLTDCKPLKAAPIAGYTLSLEIISQTIQSELDHGTHPFAGE